APRLSYLYRRTERRREGETMRLAKIDVSKVWARGDVPEDATELERDYPAIIVAEADADGEYPLIDGYHRLGAARHSEAAKIRAIIVTPEEHARLETMDEAAWIAEVA